MSDVQESILHDLILPPPPASIGKRIAASLIDAMILVIIFIVIGKLFGDPYEKTTVTTTVSSSTSSVPGTTDRVVETSSGYQLTGWPSLGFMICWFFVIPFMEGKTGGTVGKKLLRIKVIRQDGQPSTVGTSFVRHLFDCIDCFFLLGLIVALTNVNRGRVGDLVAHTYVVDKIPT
jgi:uncharacterized RDD family membrane protein YckC